ncbi:MAG: glycoside hydrolase family 37, partial [Clostridia bacterium]|nr:glycoside hydrolase family 37 [Clostridia bacterium]
MEDRLARYSDMLKQHIYASCGSMTRSPAGRLRYPYITPTSEDSPYYSDTLWDWDSWLTGITFAQ